MLYFWHYLTDTIPRQENEDILEIVDSAQFAEVSGQQVFIGSLQGDQVCQHYATRGRLTISCVLVSPDGGQSLQIPCENLSGLLSSLNNLKRTYSNYQMTQRYATNNLFCFRFVLQTSLKNSNWEQEGF
tara:strand:+ start:382 stop:768 length:387 start_codon:yes stop_codon:yes gene_type:complete